ncbi:alpha-1,3-glucosyltransferase, partial [Haematococcus lacustris]
MYGLERTMYGLERTMYGEEGLSLSQEADQMVDRVFRDAATQGWSPLEMSLEQAGGLFGAPQAGMFGQQAAAAPGTRSVPYQKIVEKDGTNSANGQPATATFLTITAMPAYLSKAMEELSAPATTGAFGASAPNPFGDSVFGAQPATTSQSSQPAGTTPASPTGATQPAFGSSPAPASQPSSLFGSAAVPACSHGPPDTVQQQLAQHAGQPVLEGRAEEVLQPGVAQGACGPEPCGGLLPPWVMELAVLLGAVLLRCLAGLSPHSGAAQRHWMELTVNLPPQLCPALLIIDHGHFQYNCLSLGAAAGAAAAILGGAPVLGSLLYCLALNHKQMALYYAPAFFGHLLGRCLQARGGLAKVGAVARLGLVVVVSFALIWSPWLTSVKDASQPIRAGLQAQLCAALTLAATAPSMLHQIMRPSPLGLMLAMANSAFAIFMFAFQVHEKSVLLPLLPISMMAAHYPGLAVWTPMVAMVSMYPLLERDGLSLPYVALML